MVLQVLKYIFWISIVVVLASFCVHPVDSNPQQIKPVKTHLVSKHKIKKKSDDFDDDDGIGYTGMYNPAGGLAGVSF